MEKIGEGIGEQRLTESHEWQRQPMHLLRFHKRFADYDGANVVEAVKIEGENFKIAWRFKLSPNAYVTGLPGQYAVFVSPGYVLAVNADEFEANYESMENEGDR